MGTSTDDLGHRRDGIGKPLEPQYDIRSDIVRRSPTAPDFEINSDRAVKRVPRDGNGNETFGWPI
jgi:hypothetical protein